MTFTGRGRKRSSGWRNWTFDSPRKEQYFRRMKRVPLFPLGLVLLPRMPLPLHIFEERYKEMFGRCIHDDEPFGIVLQTGSTFQQTGSLARIETVINRYVDGRLDVLTTGTDRFRIHEIYRDKAYLEAEVELFQDDPIDETNKRRVQELVRSAVSGLQEYARVTGYAVDTEVIENLDYEELSFLMATTSVFSTREKQELLELRCTETRIKRAARALDESRRHREMEPRVRELLGLPRDEDLHWLFN